MGIPSEKQNKLANYLNVVNWEQTIVNQLKCYCRMQNATQIS